MNIRSDPLTPDGYVASPAAARKAGARRRYLFNRWIDFLGLGGGSLFVLAAVAAFHPEDEASIAALVFTLMILANFVNHPHFAHSYQLFYGGFIRKAFSPDSPLRHRYRFAGIMVPAIMTVFFATTVTLGNAALLGLAANVMFFTVGWHYGKQGYGILMLDAARKGIRFDAHEKRHLLWNIYLTWLTSWLMVNREVSVAEFWGLEYYFFDTPGAVLAAMWTVNAVSAAVVVRDLLRRWRAGRRLPFNGLVAFVSSVYIWMIVARFDPAVVLVVPLFHSLQYLVVVWRYQLNVETSELRAHPPSAPPRPSDRGWPAPLRTASGRFARFVVAGALAGAAGFWSRRSFSTR